MSYNANGGSGAPSSQTKTEDVTLTISTTKPTRSGYTFLGWSTSSTASSASYQPGGSYSANASVTLYAVWSCNHSATKKVWDTGCDWRTVCNNCGTTISSGATHGPYTFSDWQYYSASQHKRTKECDYGDYSTIEYATHSTTTRYDQYSSSQHKKYSYCDTCSSTVGSVVYEVKKKIETSASVVTVSGEYTEGTQVISSFYFNNECSSDILPDDNVSFDFLVYCLEDGTGKTVSQQTLSKVVAPANGRNLVYFKWTVPADSAGVTFYCKGTISYEDAEKEQDRANNSIEYAVISQRKTVSQTPDTRYEKNPPAGYVSNVTPPTTNAGSATWNMWEYENDKLVLKSYGITVGNANPTITPGSGCSTAERVGSTWKMKSGYGITLSWNPSLVAKPGYIMPDSDAYTFAQDVYAAFPEFGYSVVSEKYRTLDNIGGTCQFVSNSSADKNERIHFIPVYVQNGNYIVSVTATQIWTPAGVISATRNTNTIIIEGTIYDDHYVGNR